MIITHVRMRISTPLQNSPHSEVLYHGRPHEKDVRFHTHDTVIRPYSCLQCSSPKRVIEKSFPHQSLKGTLPPAKNLIPHLPHCDLALYTMDGALFKFHINKIVHNLTQSRLPPESSGCKRVKHHTQLLHSISQEPKFFPQQRDLFLRDSQSCPRLFDLSHDNLTDIHLPV